MKTILAGFNETTTLYKKAIMIMAVLLCAFTTHSQDLTLPLSTGNPIDVYIGSTICEPSSATVTSGAWLYNPIIPFVAPDAVSQNEATYHTMIAGQTTTVIVETLYAGQLISNNQNGIPYAYGELGSNQEPTTLMSMPFVWGPGGGMAFELPIKFEKGTKNGYVSFKILDGNINDGNYTGNWVVIPISVEGPTLNNENVTIIDTIVEPQIPYLILHAPPGDGSISSFQKNKTICRKLETNYAGEESNAANLAVKLGIAGEAGLFVTTEFEFSVTFSAGLTVGNMMYTASAEETCISVSEGFATSSMLDDEGGGDVFVGYGTDLALGIYEYRRIDPLVCSSVLDTGLIYAPVGELRQFAKTSSGIQSNIAALEIIVADSLNVDVKTVNDAQNQIDVWNQVLDLNLANVSNPNNEPIGMSFDLDATATVDRQESIQVVETSAIEYQHYTNVNLGLSAKVEVAGSGFEGGYEFKGSKRFGESQNQSETESQLVKYILSDDDGGDNFNVQVVRDPMYGTPIFKVDESQSRSSCPYQVGYQRDQPLLTFVGEEQELALENIPVGGTGTFQIQICNDSEEDRTYYLKGNSNTNLDGVIIEGFGNNLFNTNDQGIEFYNVPANDCLNVATLTVKQANLDILDYEDIEIVLNVDCQPASAPITSSIFLSVHFSESTSVSDLERSNLMSIVPNPNSGHFFIEIDSPMEQGQLILSDITGKIVHTQNVQKGSESIQVNQNGIKPGVYLLGLKNGTGMLTQKVVINR